MEPASKKAITVETSVNAPISKVWKYWSGPEHIKKWNNASDDWHTPRAQNDLRPGGKFLSRMESKDGRDGFDFEGVYDEVNENKFIAYTIGDGRKVTVSFSGNGNETRITETFEAENAHSLEMQRGGWQAILDSFKNYVETH